MPYSVVTNGNLDTVAAAVAAPFGPFTRVGDAAAVSPNSNLPVEMTAATGETIYVSYDTLNSAVLLEEFLKETFGLGYLMNKIKLMIEVINASIQDIAPPPATDAEVKQILQSLKLLPTLFASVPWVAHLEWESSQKVAASFVNTPTGLSVDFVQTITGQKFLHLWDFGDGTTSLADDPTHVYAGAGTYTVRLIVIGAGGVVEVSNDVTVA